MSVHLVNHYAAEGFPLLQKAVQEDLGYAWAWHCLVATVLHDAGVAHKEANERAADFMKRVFRFDTRQCKEYPA